MDIFIWGLVHCKKKESKRKDSQDRPSSQFGVYGVYRFIRNSLLNRGFFSSIKMFGFIQWLLEGESVIT